MTIVYRDRAFCAASMHEGCNNWACTRNYTERDAAHNKETVKLPVSTCDFRTPTCGYSPVPLKDKSA